jgi:hypothetical protein
MTKCSSKLGQGQQKERKGYHDKRHLTEDESLDIALKKGT